MPVERPLAAGILAGGTARRLGGAQKALLTIGGVPIIERQIAALRPVADPLFIVAPDSGPYAHLGLRVVGDRLAGCGALGGIYTAIVESPHERVVVVACDMPFISPELLRLMADASGADIVVPRSPRGIEPLCAIYTRACAPSIRARLDRGMLEASVMPEGMKVLEIGAETLAAHDPDGLLFVNVNTPHDYERARERVESPSKPRRSYHE
jgi:molybdopterin-guanine dinucleotide biosynthesis protein A